MGTNVIDSIYTPVKDVGYVVEYTRVGDITNYEKLTINVESVTAGFNMNPDQSCLSSATIQFNNTSVNGATYLWEFGDGTTSTTQNLSKNVTTPADQDQYPLAPRALFKNAVPPAELRFIHPHSRDLDVASQGNP